MMMTFGAFEANAKKELADRGADLDRLGPIPEKDNRAVAPGTPLGGDQFTHKLIVRLVLAKGVPEPGIQVPDRLDAGAVGIGAEQVGPLVRPEVGVLRAFEQVINQPLTFVESLV